MKAVKKPGLALCLCLLLLGRLPLRAAESSTGPSSYDAVAAAPENHRVVFENETVRILEVTIKPGEKEPFHEHPLSSVMTIISGAPLRITQATVQDGNIVTGKTIEVGKDNFQPPPLWMPPQGLHSAENIGTVVFLAYRIELKEGRRSHPTKASD
jgi:mannose-6-phosphate isomerase-like protein (cupin superfamily)